MNWSFNWIGFEFECGSLFQSARFRFMDLYVPRWRNWQPHQTSCFITMQGALLSKGNNVNLENCWNSLIAPMTTTWLETANVKVIKLWEIGQSAAEPLIKEEGSETMHETAKRITPHAEDIVQTTTT